VHFHVVSTRIDCDTGKKIKDSYENEKTQRFIKDLEQKYQLTKDEPQEKLNYRFSGSSKNLKQNLESLFGQLNRMEFITSKKMYDQALKLFNVEIRKAGRGYSVFVTDENENPVRHPVKMRDFVERPMFYLSEHQTLTQHHSQHFNSDQTFLGTGVLKSLVLKELIRQTKTQFDKDSSLKSKRHKLKSQKNRYGRKL